MALQAAPVRQKSWAWAMGQHSGIQKPKDACFVSSIKPSRSGVILFQSPFSNGHPERVTPIAILVAATMAQRGS